MDYISKLSLPSISSRHLPPLAVGLSSLVVLACALKPRYLGLPSVPAYPGLSHVKRTDVVQEALHLYPADFYDGGGWAELPWGKVRYWIIGPAEGSKVVLVHGFSVPGIVYKDVAERLVEAGYRVMIYDLYGRGHSDAPQTEYSATLFSTQLALLLQYVGWEKPALVGYSMGGAIITSFTHLYPKLAGNKIVLIASAGVMKHSDSSLIMELLSSPLMSAILCSSALRWVSRYLYKSSKPSLQPVPPTAAARIAKYTPLQRLVLPGYVMALSSTGIYGPARNQKEAFIYLSSRSVLIISGRNDASVPYRCALEINELAKGSKLFPVEGAAHDVTFTHPDVVAGAIIDHLKDV